MLNYPENDEIERLLGEPGEIDRLLGVTEVDARWRNRPKQSHASRHLESLQCLDEKIKLPEFIRSKTVKVLIVSSIAVTSILAWSAWSVRRESMTLQQSQDGTSADYVMSKETGKTSKINTIHHVVIEAEQDSWMEIRGDSKATIFEGILPAGKELNIAFPYTIEVYSGKPEALYVSHDGKRKPLGWEMRWYSLPETNGQ